DLQRGLTLDETRDHTPIDESASHRGRELASAGREGRIRDHRATLTLVEPHASVRLLNGVVPDRPAWITLGLDCDLRTCLGNDQIDALIPRCLCSLDLVSPFKENIRQEILKWHPLHKFPIGGAQAIDLTLEFPDEFLVSRFELVEASPY